MKALFIDNFDFTYSLADEFEKKGCEVLVYRNDADLRVIDAAIKKFKPSLIVVSGSGSIKNSGNSSEIISAHIWHRRRASLHHQPFWRQNGQGARGNIRKDAENNP